MDITLSALPAYQNTGQKAEDKYFTENDSIELYLSNSALNLTSYVNMYANNSPPNTTTSAFVFSGTIGSVAVNEQEGRKTIEITCADKTAVLTNINAKRTAYSASSPTKTYIYKKNPGSDELSAIDNLLDEVNSDMRQAYEEDVPEGGNKWQNITIASDCDDVSDLSGYLRLDVGFLFKTYAEIFNEFISGAYTNDIQYTYWIDGRNQFHIMKLANAKTGDIVYGTDRMNNFKFSEEVYDTVNAAIVNAGVDLNGVGIWWYAHNEASATEVGLRWDVIANVKTAQHYYSILGGNILTNGTATSVSGKVLTDSGKSWSVNAYANKWLINPTPPNAFKIVSNTSDTITVDGEGLKQADYFVYDGTNSSFRETVRDAAVSVAEAQLAKTAKLRYKGTITLNGTLSHNLNEVYDIEQSYLGFTATTPKRMRLTDIAHNVGNGSWKTSLTFKEDVGTEGTQ